MLETESEKREMAAFMPTENYGPFDEKLDESLPEFAFVDFLTGWHRNFGKMAKRGLNITQKPINQLAGHLRNDVMCVALKEFEILSVRQVTVARAEAIVRMKGITIEA